MKIDLIIKWDVTFNVCVLSDKSIRETVSGIDWFEVFALAVPPRIENMELSGSQLALRYSEHLDSRKIHQKIWENAVQFSTVGICHMKLGFFFDYMLHEKIFTTLYECEVLSNIVFEYLPTIIPIFRAESDWMMNVIRKKNPSPSMHAATDSTEQLKMKMKTKYIIIKVCLWEKL